MHEMVKMLKDYSIHHDGVTTTMSRDEFRIVSHPLAEVNEQMARRALHEWIARRPKSK